MYFLRANPCGGKKKKRSRTFIVQKEELKYSTTLTNPQSSQWWASSEGLHSEFFLHCAEIVGTLKSSLT